MNETQQLKAYGKLTSRALDQWAAGTADWLYVVRPGGITGDRWSNVLLEAFLVGGYDAALTVFKENGGTWK